MAQNNDLHAMLLLALFSLLLLVPFSASADSLLKKQPDYSLFPKMRFDVELDKTHAEQNYLADRPEQRYSLGYESLPHGQLFRDQPLIDQYDATFYYPLGSEGMSFDLGINMRYISGQTSYLEDGERRVRNFSAALPMLSASALFDLPFKGLTAGFEGKRYMELENDNRKGFDYRYKLRYEWDKSFGLQGGWQHQQFSLDHADETSTNFEQKGPFLDLYLRF
jgi:hypothetical protein